MKIFKSISLAIIFIGLHISCDRKGDSTSGQISLSFEINDEAQLKSTDAEPKILAISIKNSKGELVLNLEKQPLIKVGDEYLTRHIELPVGRYTIDDFLVLDGNDSTLYLTPKTGSEFASYVSTPLPYKFTVEKNEVTTTLLDVLPAKLGDANQYGYATFGFNIVKVIEIQPDSITGKDAFVHSYHPDKNYGNYPILQSLCWTIFGSDATLRSFMQFDLSQIAPDEEIVFATLSLYEQHLAENPTDGHSHLSNSNASYISRVTEDWDQSTITWNNQPSVADANHVMIPQDTSAYQDYVNINVTSLIKDIIKSPEGNHGLMLSLVDESPYCALYFASSNYKYRHKRPKLTLYIK